MEGRGSCVPCVRVLRAGRSQFTPLLSPVLQNAAKHPFLGQTEGSWPRASGGGGGSPGRRAGKPRGCAPLRLSQLGSGKLRGLERLGPAEGLNLLGKVRVRGISPVGGRRAACRICLPRFLRIFRNNDHSVPTGLLRESLPYVKI